MITRRSFLYFRPTGAAALCSSASRFNSIKTVFCSGMLLAVLCCVMPLAASATEQLPANVSIELNEALKVAEQMYGDNAAEGKKLFSTLKSRNQDEQYYIQQRLCWTLAPSEPEAAIALVNAAQALPELWQLRFNLCQAYAKEQQGDNQQALKLYQELLANPLSTEDQVMYARALTLRGEQHAIVGSYPEALQDLKQAYQLEQQLGNTQNLSYVSNALANLYADPAIADYKEAVAMYQQTLAYHKQQQNQQDEATALYNLGSTYESMGELEQALNYLHQALKVEEQRASPEDTAYTKRAIARVLTKAGKANEAIKLLNEAILYYQQSDNKEHLAYCQLSRAISYMALQQWSQAEQDLIQAADYFRKNPNARFEARIYKEYASLAAAQQQWQKAFLLQQQQFERDSYLQQQLLDNRTSALKTQLQTEQIQSEKELLAQKNQQQLQQLQDAESLRRWQVIALIFAVLLIVTLLLMMHKQKKLSAQLRDLALLDELTRLPNRRHTLAMAEQLWQQSSQSGQPLVVLALDIDFFKKVNDTFGHQAGDLVLQKVGHCLRTYLRPQDKVGRVGGEEFLLLLPNTNSSQATEIAQRLCQLVAELNFDELAPAQQVTVSIGIAGRTSQQDLLALWHQADTALYQAKQQGRNRAVLAG